MKSVAILTTMAAAVGAQQSLRGDWEQGVEEVGEQIEFFPNVCLLKYHLVEI